MKIVEITNRIYISDQQWKKEIKNNVYPDDRSRAAVAEISPDDFLFLADDSNGQASDRALQYGQFDNEKFTSDWLPTLDITIDGKVYDHEGRARATMIKKSNISKMPIILRLPANNRVKSKDEFPNIITQQSGSKAKRINIKELLSYNSTNPFK